MLIKISQLAVHRLVYLKTSRDFVAEQEPISHFGHLHLKTIGALTTGIHVGILIGVEDDYGRAGQAGVRINHVTGKNKGDARDQVKGHAKPQPTTFQGKIRHNQGSVGAEQDPRINPLQP
jgi:hypothetical protein